MNSNPSNRSQNLKISSPSQPHPQPKKEESVFRDGWASREDIRRRFMTTDVSVPRGAGLERMASQQRTQQLMKELGLLEKSHISFSEVRRKLKELRQKEYTGQLQERWRAKAIREYLEKILK